MHSASIELPRYCNSFVGFWASNHYFRLGKIVFIYISVILPHLSLLENIFGVCRTFQSLGCGCFLSVVFLLIFFRHFSLMSAPEPVLPEHNQCFSILFLLMITSVSFAFPLRFLDSCIVLSSSHIARCKTDFNPWFDLSFYLSLQFILVSLS